MTTRSKPDAPEGSPEHRKWLEDTLLPVMIIETDPYGPRDLVDDDDDFGLPQGVADAMEELDRAVMEDIKNGIR